MAARRGGPPQAVRGGFRTGSTAPVRRRGRGGLTLGDARNQLRFGVAALLGSARRGFILHAATTRPLFGARLGGLALAGEPQALALAAKRLTGATLLRLELGE